MSKTKRILILIVVLLVATLLNACTAGKAPKRQADITFASITDSTREGDVLILYLETNFKAARKFGVPIEKSKYTKAMVRIDKSTKIFAATGLGNSRASSGEILKSKESNKHGGGFLDVWFRGPVRQSDPVQATADTIFF